MLNNYTIVLYGWQVNGNDKVHKLVNKLEKFDEDYLDKFQNILVDDPMCGNYFYFGAILARYDTTEDHDPIVVDKELVDKSTEIYNKIINKNPELEKIFKKFQKEPAKLYIFQNIW